MGCGASKGKAEADPTAADINFKAIGVASMDSFFDKAKEVLDNFANITGPLSE
jgi:hypothetical protein